MKDLNPAVKESLTAQDHIRDATKMVKCICGDIYQADSFGAGFIAATGRCQNCCAAEQEEQEPVAYFLDIKAGFSSKPLYEQVSDEYKNDADVFPLYAAPQPVQQEPMMDYERINALREGEQNGAEDAYFFVRPENDTPTLRKMFCQGFERGFHKGLKYASPVQQVDLTDDDKAEIECALNMAHNLLCWPVDSIAEMYCFGMGDCDEVRQQLNDARAVIAADREKNRG